MRIHSQSRRQSAFTMVEIALCLAIVGFALVAIIGVLPTGMNVQKDNRAETIINQDAAVLIDAIRSGAQGFDDLTNYVISITNYWREMDPETLELKDNSGHDDYLPLQANVTSVSTVPSGPLGYVLTGYRIIGLLSTPRYSKGFTQSNYVTAYFRSLSGAAVEKTPQNNGDVLENAFAYRLIVENTPYLPFDTNSVNFAATGLTAPEAEQRTNSWRLFNQLKNSSRDLRLTFRWPVLPNGVGNGRQTYRLLVGGQVTATNDLAGQPLYFLEPSTYVAP